MTGRRFRAAFLLAAASAAGLASASQRAPLPETAYDSGVASAETLGRGNTIASNRGTAASGSENPAALDGITTAGALYATTLVDVRSPLPNSVANQSDALNGKVLQYLSINAEKGVLFYEPVSRLGERQVVDATTGQYRDVDLETNAIGFAGADKLGTGGSMGLSLAYLWSALSVTDYSAGTITRVQHDTMDGLRLNLGVRYPTGPAMWGLVVQNGPGFLWGSTFTHEQLPIKIRIGNTYRLAQGILFSVDGERRFYRQGGDAENVLYLGNETFLSDRLVARVGVFGTNVGDPKDRHTTGGLTFSAANGTAISGALEAYRLDDDKVKRIFVSVQLPFVTGGN